MHAEDIRRPLGVRDRYDAEALRAAADSYMGSNTLTGAKNRIAGLGLRSTDQDWSTGTGPRVEGPMLSLVAAMTGRESHVDDLTGEGVETLRGRCRYSPRARRSVAAGRTGAMADTAIFHVTLRP